MYSKFKEIFMGASVLSKCKEALTQEQTNGDVSNDPSNDSSNDTSCDIMISYSHYDIEFAWKLKEVLEANNYSVWIDKNQLTEGDSFIDKIGEAIINSKVVIPIISKTQIISKFCIGEVALAFITEKMIIPCLIGNKLDIVKAMPSGLRLQLAEYEWIEFSNQNIDYSDPKRLFDRVLSKLAEVIEITATSKTIVTKNIHKLTSTDSSETSDANEVDFWQLYFPDQTEVRWKEFNDTLKEAISNFKHSELFANNYDSFSQRLYKEICDKSTRSVSYSTYKKFMEPGNTESFLICVKHYWSEHLAVKEVFDINSNVRLNAIERLSKYPSERALEALLDLTEDDDANCRAVSLLTLAKLSQKYSEEFKQRALNRICCTLDDDDRLVRECSCLALANIGSCSDAVVDKVVNVWRNDVIASVRQCAEIALNKFDNEQARIAVHMTGILKSEIDKLK